MVLDDNVTEAFEFVWDMLTAEADALKEKCAYAIRFIAEMEKAAYQVHDMQNEIKNEEFRDGD